MAETNDNDPPFVGGSQPVKQKPDPLPGGGRSALQTMVIVLAVIAVIVGIAWIAVPILGG